MRIIDSSFRQTRHMPTDQLALQVRCHHPSGTWQEFPRSALDGTIHGRFEQMVAQFPQRIALKSPYGQFTYLELNHAANQVADILVQTLGMKHEPIGCLFGQDIGQGIAYYGILKSGKILVEMSPLNPDAHNLHILRDTAMRLIVTNTRHLDKAQGLMASYDVTGGHVINIDEWVLNNTENGDSSSSIEYSSPPVRPDDIAYIVFTSGSTGKPKGVAHTHRDDLHCILEVVNTYYTCPQDRAINLGSTATYMTPTYVGATACHFDVRAQGFLALAHWLQQEQITWITAMPTTLRQLLQSVPAGFQLSHLRLVMVAGEPLLPEDLHRCKQVFSPNVVIIYGFAMTETWRVSRNLIDLHTYVPSGTIPAGYPALDKEVLLLDDKGEQVALGESGEIAVRSAYMAWGYWNQPELTRVRFLPDPEGGDQRIFLTGDMGRFGVDGALYHLGRKDHMVKIRGFRVELAPIEATLRKIAEVYEAAVVAKPDHEGELRLISYIVLMPGFATTVSALRHFLSEHLPEYMIPSVFVFLDEMPTTSSGKVDRQNLPEPTSTRPPLDIAYIAPRTPVEEKLSTIWANTLGLDKVGIHDNFLDLGGHSLLASRIVTHVIDTFGIELALQELFQSPTVAEMALVVVQSLATHTDPEILHNILASMESATKQKPT